MGLVSLLKNKTKKTKKGSRELLCLFTMKTHGGKMVIFQEVGSQQIANLLHLDLFYIILFLFHYKKIFSTSSKNLLSNKNT